MTTFSMGKKKKDYFIQENEVNNERLQITALFGVKLKVGRKNQKANPNLEMPNSPTRS